MIVVYHLHDTYSPVSAALRACRAAAAYHAAAALVDCGDNAVCWCCCVLLVDWPCLVLLLIPILAPSRLSAVLPLRAMLRLR